SELAAMEELSADAEARAAGAQADAARTRSALAAIERGAAATTAAAAAAASHPETAPPRDVTDGSPASDDEPVRVPPTVRYGARATRGDGSAPGESGPSGRVGEGGAFRAATPRVIVGTPAVTGPSPRQVVAAFPEVMALIWRALDTADFGAIEPHARQLHRWFDAAGQRRLTEIASHLELACTWRDQAATRALLVALERDFGDGAALLR
ncbi:MAG: hypothetical protein CVU56_06755, partial [Deltaproteobacteria bacterium HGW-Deltaproteobacteria-14]